jgi:hypothetical protein
VDTPASVDRNAPVLAHHEIDIGAPLSRVWALHEDVNAFTLPFAPWLALAVRNVQAVRQAIERSLDPRVCWRGGT